MSLIISLFCNIGFQDLSLPRYKVTVFFIQESHVIEEAAIVNLPNRI
jgi:hypothetical protein